ncbi:hypothetical protein FIU83_00670 [Halomonas sp. THAF5a]|uniref:DUF3015 family protein n=1 Tax=Halomonas sp. THAF5a TaxID=2587844 RepID=UPI0012693847|nr:DUF3015 family protein [Halomonas sp. THAF5a]QFU00152.1 hypothetical protein FIU83_00670 [Halomonas sp. THAF5a]
MKYATVSAAALAGSLMLLGATTASAASQSNINPWKECGIGAGIFDDNGTAAALSNIIWDSGTTAVTSATLSPETCSGRQVEVAQFVDQTYDQLAMETAMGEGEHLTAALGLMDCSAEARPSVVSQLRADLQEASATAGYADQAHADKAFQYYDSLNQAAADCAAS